MDAALSEPEEAASAAASEFVSDITASAASRRDVVEAFPISECEGHMEFRATEQDGQDYLDVRLGPHDTFGPASQTPTNAMSPSPPAGCDHRNESRLIVDTPSTDVGPTPSPTWWRLDQSTSSSFGRRGDVSTPVPRANTSMAMSTYAPRANSSMAVSTPAPRANTSMAFRASTSMAFAHGTEHDAAVDDPPFVPSPFKPTSQRIAPGGTRRPVMQRGASFPAVNPSSPISTGASPLEGGSIREKGATPERDFLCAQLSARQFVSEIVLGKVLELGPLSSTQKLPDADDDVETISQVPLEFVASMNAVGSPTVDCSTDELDDVAAAEASTMDNRGQGPQPQKAEAIAFSGALCGKIRPSANPRTNKLVMEDAGSESTQAETTIASPRKPAPRQGPQAPRGPRHNTVPSKGLQVVDKVNRTPSKPLGRRASAMPVSSSAQLDLTVARPRRRSADELQRQHCTPPSSPSDGPLISVTTVESAPLQTATAKAKAKTSVPQEPVSRLCACGAVISVESSSRLYCRKCVASRKNPTRRSMISSMQNARKRTPASPKSLKESEAASMPATTEDEHISTEEQEQQDVVFDIHGGTFALLGYDTLETQQGDVNEGSNVGAEPEFDEIGHQFEFCGQQGETEFQSSEVSSIEQLQWQTATEVQDQTQLWHAVPDDFSMYQYQNAEEMSQHALPQHFFEYDGAELALTYDVGTDPSQSGSLSMTLGSSVPVGWAHDGAYDQYAAVSSFGALGEPYGWAVQGVQPHSELEATVTGEQLGQLFASSCFGNFCASSPVTLSLDEETAAVVYAAAGIPLHAVDNAGDDQYETESEGAAAEEEALHAADEAAIAEDELTAEKQTREIGRRSFREKTNAERDLVVVKAQCGMASHCISAPSSAAKDELGDEVGAMSDRSSVGADAPSVCDATGLQVQSARLLEELHGWRSRGASINMRPKHGTRPNSVAGILEAGSRTVPPSKIPASQDKLSAKSRIENRPEWDTSFMSVHERRIPNYDALIDDNCLVMTSPARLKQVLRTRELSSEYLHVVRARFESHRRLFDPDYKLGDRSRPEPTMAQKLKTRPSRLPSTLLARIAELRDGAPALGEDDDDEQGPTSLLTTECGPQEEWMHVAPSLACSTEWLDTPIHCQCLKERREDAEDGVPLLIPDDDAGSANEELPARWERLRGRIQILWRELIVPAEVSDIFIQGPFTAVTADSVYRLEMHHKELLDFRAATKRIVHECLERDEVFDAVQHAHTLGVNDGRLSMLRQNLAVLDGLGTSIVRAIGIWSRRFGHLVVDVGKSFLRQHDVAKPRAVFIWKGRDAVERIQTESHAISAGRPQDLFDLAREQQPQDGDNAGSARENKAIAKHAPAPLVSLAMVSQKFQVNDVLHEGPPPTWYQPKIAKAGVAAIRRGVPCGGGDKRI